MKKRKKNYSFAHPQATENSERYEPINVRETLSFLTLFALVFFVVLVGVLTIFNWFV